MFAHSADRAFRRFQEHGDSRALARVFDATAPELQRLARYLASPEAPAEDLLQATYLTAIESKQRFDPTQRVLPWLVGILANHAREARRRDRRVIDPRRIRADAGLDPSDAAAASELTRTLDATIARLPEAHRAVLRLYLLHGLEPAEIARSLERPPGTVRAQLSRGLKSLRRILPEGLVTSHAYAFVSPSRLAAIRAEVLERSGAAPAAVATTSLSLPFLAMTLNKKLLVAAGVLLAGFLAFELRGEPSREDTTTLVAAEVPQVPEPPAAVVGAAPEAPEPARVEALREQAAAPPPPLAEAPVSASLLVKVTDGNGTALPGIGVALRTMTELQNPGALLRFVTTDAEGTVLFEHMPVSRADSRVVVETDRSDVRGVATLVAGERKELALDIKGVRVEGNVVDGYGAPVADATICVHSERIESLPIARTDARGEFRLEHIGPRMALQAHKAGLAPSKAHPVLGKRGETWQVQLALHGQAGEVAGRVLDPNGTPVEGALVAFVPDAAKDVTPYDRNGPQTRSVQVRTDAEGRFHSLEVPLGTVIATAAGSHSDWTPASVRIEVGTAPQRLELGLGIGAVLEGTITADGKPLQGYQIHVFCSQPDMPASYLFNLLATRNTTSDAHGEFRISGILPGQVEMRILRRGMETKAQQTVAMVAGETLRWDLDCSADAGQAFEITIDPPVPSSGLGAWLVQVNCNDQSKGFVGLQSGDLNGRARFERLAPGRYTAVVHLRPGVGDLIPLATCEFDTREERLTLRIPAERLRMQPVRGRLLDVSGAVLKERSVQVRCADGGYPMVLQRVTELDGGFTFATLPPGSYVLQLLQEGAPVTLREFQVIGDRAEDLGDVRIP